MRAVAHLKAILISVHWDEGTSFQLYEIRDFDIGSVIVGYRSVSGNQPVPNRAAAVVKVFLRQWGGVAAWGGVFE